MFDLNLVSYIVVVASLKPSVLILVTDPGPVIVGSFIVGAVNVLLLNV